MKLCYIVLYAKYERKKMVQLIQNFFNSLRFPAIAHGDNFDNVDTNLIRYFRTEYGRDWKGALSEHLYHANKKGLK